MVALGFSADNLSFIGSSESCKIFRSGVIISQFFKLCLKSSLSYIIRVGSDVYIFRG